MDTVDNLHEKPDKVAAAYNEESDRTGSANDLGQGGHPELHIGQPKREGRATSGRSRPSGRFTGAAAPRPKPETLPPLTTLPSDAVIRWISAAVLFIGVVLLLVWASSAPTHRARSVLLLSDTFYNKKLEDRQRQPFGALSFGFPERPPCWRFSTATMFLRRDLQAPFMQTFECHPSKPCNTRFTGFNPLCTASPNRLTSHHALGRRRHGSIRSSTC